jgi:pteridine reductase
MHEAHALVDQLNMTRSNSATSLSADLCNLSMIDNLAEQALASWGHVDVLVNNASSFYPTPIGGITDSVFDTSPGTSPKSSFWKYRKYG